MSAKIHRIINVCLVVLGLFAAGTQYSYAYLDPSSGSYILQMALAGMLGAMFVIKSFWTQIRSFIADKILRRSAPKQ